MFARFSEAFLNLRAKDLGWEIAHLPLLLVAYDLVCGAIAIPTGKWADRISRFKIFLLGIAVLIVTNMVIIGWSTKEGIFLGMVMAGLHMGMTQGLIAAMIAESTLKHLRGTAFALYYFTSGTAVLLGNTLAGRLSDTMGTSGAFWVGLFFSSLSLMYGTYIFYKK
jgi:MFS family permease